MEHTNVVLWSDPHPVRVGNGPANLNSLKVAFGDKLGQISAKYHEPNRSLANQSSPPAWNGGLRIHFVTLFVHIHLQSVMILGIEFDQDISIMIHSDP